MRYRELTEGRAAIPRPLPQHIRDAIQHADVYGEGWTKKDFTVHYLGLLTPTQIEKYDDLSSWLEVSDASDLTDYRSGDFDVGADTKFPPIIIVTAPQEGQCSTQIGDGRGRVNWANAHGMSLHAYHMIHKRCLNQDN